MKYKHKITNIIGELWDDGHLHFDRTGGEMCCHETLWKGFIENSNDWEKVEEIPEYVECIEECELSSETTKGNIYEIEKEHTNGDWVLKGIKYSVAKRRFKHSTKLAFDNQELLKKAKEKYPVGTRFNSTGGYKNVVIPKDVKFVINNNNVQVKNKNSGHIGEVYNKYRDEWAEIIEDKNYEILAFNHKISGIVTLNYKDTSEYPYSNNGSCFYSEKFLLESKAATIHSIKRLSDNQVFTVGDRITGYTYNTPRKIEKFEEVKSSIYLCSGIGRTLLKDAKLAKTPLFITDDNVDVFEGDTYYCLQTEKELIPGGKNYYIGKIQKITIQGFPNVISDLHSGVNEVNLNEPTIKRFSTKEAAEQYIEDNKPRFSKKEIEEALAEVWFRDTEEEAVFKLILRL